MVTEPQITKVGELNPLYMKPDLINSKELTKKINDKIKDFAEKIKASPILDEITGTKASYDKAVTVRVKQQVRDPFHIL